MSKTAQRLALKIACAVAILAVVGFVMVHLPRLQAGSVGTPKELLQFQAEDEARRTLAQIIGGLVIAVGVYYTARRVTAIERQVDAAFEQVVVAQEGQLTERFTRAIAQLGSDKIAIRLGGIYSLGRVAKDSAGDHQTVMEVLTAFVRENMSETAIGTHTHPEKPRVDIQAILTVIGRRQVQREIPGQWIDLCDTYLANLELWGANLGGSLLVGANLSDARLHDVDLSNASLHHADLTNAFLSGGTNLRDTKLNETNLSGADLSGATNLTAEQVDSAITNEDTQLPDYLTQPDEPADDDAEDED